MWVGVILIKDDVECVHCAKNQLHDAAFEYDVLGDELYLYDDILYDDVRKENHGDDINYHNGAGHDDLMCEPGNRDIAPFYSKQPVFHLQRLYPPAKKLDLGLYYLLPFYRHLNPLTVKSRLWQLLRLFS